MKIQFPKIPEIPNLVWQDNNGYVAFVETKEMVILYIWDGFSVSWNEMRSFPKREFEMYDLIPGSVELLERRTA